MADRSKQGPNIAGGGGIVFGDVDRSQSASPASSAELMNAIRKRWVTGVSILTAVDQRGGFRGVTANSFAVISVNPATIAVALSTEGSFYTLLENNDTFGGSVLDQSHSFLADRFAGRAPIPDPAFTGVPHLVHESGVPIISDANCWFVGTVVAKIPVGDHILLLAEMKDGETPEDSDDPLVSYEGRFRRLEAG